MYNSILNPNYNPNDSSINRWIPSSSPFLSTPTISGAPQPTPQPTFGALFANIAQPFKTLLTPKPTPTPTPGGVNMSYAPAPSTINQSKVPLGPVLPGTPAPAPAPTNIPGQVRTPDPTVLALQKSLNAKGAGLVEDGQMGPKTQAAQAKFGGAAGSTTGAPGTPPPTIPTTPSGTIDYANLAKVAGAAGVSIEDYINLVKGQAAPGTEGMNAIYDQLGIPGLLHTVYTKPDKTTQQIYQDYYDQSGLGDVKKKIAELDTQLNTIRTGYTGAVKEHQDNPWLSSATRSARIAREKDLYGQQEANAIALRSSYLDQYNMGVGEIEKATTRVATDLEKDRTLNADKLNYLLNDAERRAGLTVTDAAKTGLRYGGDFLSSKKAAADAKDTLAFNRQVKLSDRQAGQNLAAIRLKASLDKKNSVGAIVEQALKTNPTGAAYINGIQNALGADTSEQGRNFALQTIAGKIANGDTKGAQEYLIGVALGKDPKARENAIAANTVIDNLTAIKSALNAYAAKYGDTNILKGSIQNIQQKLGVAGNEDAAKLRGMITDNLQTTRNQITGAAWGSQEDAEYKTTNANLMNSNRLNMAIIDSSIATAKRKNDAALGTLIGRETYNTIFSSPTTSSGSASLTPDQVASYITTARSQNIPDDQIESYLISKGVKLQ